MKIVCIGDSITYGYGVGPGQNWVHLLAGRFNAQFINRGSNGDTTGGMLRRFTAQVVKAKPDMVIIMGGSNDIISYFALEQSLSNINAMISQARENDIQPLLGIPLPMDVPNVTPEWSMFFDPLAAEQKNRQYAARLKALAEEVNITVLDFRALFEGAEHMAGLYFDGLHPNPAGHRLMADVVEQKLNDLGVS